MLAQLPGKVEADGGLDLPTGDGVLLVVVRQARRLGGDPLENIVHERVHDAHRLAGDASVGVDLSQNLVDVDRIAFFTGLPPLLFVSGGRFGLCGGLLLALLGCDFTRHGKRFYRSFPKAPWLREMQKRNGTLASALVFEQTARITSRGLFRHRPIRLTVSGITDPNPLRSGSLLQSYWSVVK